MTNNFMTSKQVAELFKVTPQTVNAWARSGALRSVRVGPRTRRFLLPDLLDYLRDRVLEENLDYLHSRVAEESDGQAVVETLD